MNSVSNTSPSFTCPICLDNDGITTGRSGGRTLVRTSCQPKPHIFHLECITRWLEGEQQQNKRLNLRQCGECKQPVLPLVRLQGSHIQEDESPYCESLMLHACRTGDQKTINNLLALDASQATRTHRSALTGKPAHPLAIAIESGHMDCVQTLIDHQADVNAADQDGQTPLHIAAGNGNVQCLKWLVTRGANVNVTNRNGETPLHLAIKVGTPEHNRQWTAMGRSIADLYPDWTAKNCISKERNGIACLKELLANSEVNVNVSDNDGITPLMVAALFGAPVYLRWLLDAGADLYVNDHYGWTALHFAASSNCAKSINVLLAVVPQINISKKDIHGWTAFHIAANNCTETLKVLLDTPGTQINERDDKGLTPVHLAAKFNREASLKMLLDTPGIRVNKKNKKGWTALHLAAKHDSAESIEKLLNTPGIRVNKKTTRGWTALHLAAKYDSIDSVEILLNHPDIQVNKKTDSGKTALHIATEYGNNIVTVKLLLATPGIPRLRA